MRVSIISVDSLLIEFCNKIDIECAKKVQISCKIIKEEFDIKEIVASYSSLMVTFDIIKYDIREMRLSIVNRLKDIKFSNLTLKVEEKRVIEIPAFYSLESGPDLKRVANYSRLSVAEVVRIHSSRTYFVYTIGFLIGFAYMGEVDSRIATPRLNTPRSSVDRGSVAIANKQCSIYPIESAGGWNLIAKNTIEMGG